MNLSTVREQSSTAQISAFQRTSYTKKALTFDILGMLQPPPADSQS
jgi:hypothetical protein